jgi:hypothetical protein
MKAKSAMDIFKVLEKSNCAKCGEKTCLAFAGAVYVGRRKIQECPQLDAATIAALRADHASDAVDFEFDFQAFVAQQAKAIRQLEFTDTAKRIGGAMKGDRLMLEILGKSFTIDRSGNFHSDLHMTPWLLSPLLDYVLNCKGVPVKGEWISMREIDGGKEKYPLFKKRGEDVLKSLADKYTDFFNDIIHMFDGEQVAEQFASDISVVLHPLPLVPIMLCYWRPDDGLASTLNVFFDRSINQNLNIESAFMLASGIARMVEKLAEHHAF